MLRVNGKFNFIEGSSYRESRFKSLVSFFMKVPLRCLPSSIVTDEEGRKKGCVQYVYFNDLFNARCNATRCSFTSGKKGVTKPHLRADSARPYLPNGVLLS